MPDCVIHAVSLSQVKTLRGVDSFFTVLPVHIVVVEVVSIVPDLIAKISMAGNHTLGFEVSSVAVPSLHLCGDVRRSHPVGRHITGSVGEHAVAKFIFVITVRF